MTTSTAPASTCWFSFTGTSITVPPTRAAIGVTCASTCASSVVSRPAVAQTHADVASKAIASLRQLLIGQVARPRRDLQLLAGRLQVEERGPHVVVDLGALVLRLR